MKKLLAALLLCLSSLSCQAEPRALPVKFDFQAISVPQVIQLVYSEVLKQSFVLDPALLADQRTVSFRYDSSTSDVRSFWLSFLDSLGLSVETKAGVDFVSVKKAESQRSLASDVLVYRPQYRSVSYLVDAIGSLFKSGSFSVQRSIKTPPDEPVPSNAPPNSAAALLQTDSDVLLFSGSADDVALLKHVLSEVDVAQGEVFVRASVFEVSTSAQDGSGFSLALNVLGGKLGLSLGTPAALPNALTIKTNSVDVAFGALQADSRFKTISAPRVRVKSGTSARLVVGQDVPTLGSLTYAVGANSPVQSVEYRSAGVIFGITPTVRNDSIDLQVDQQVSDFVVTETGVNNSPTLNKRSLTTTVSLADGEVVLLGGLTSHKHVDSTNGLSWLPRALATTSRGDDEVEILILLEAERVHPAAVAAR
ncbi:MAG: type II secretory pathway protein [Aquabacterium sp.]